MEIKPGKYRTRDGRCAVVAGVNPTANWGNNIIGWLEGQCRGWPVGGVYGDGFDGTDLIAPWVDPPAPVIKWLNIYPGLNPVGGMYDSHEEATKQQEKIHGRTRIACVKITYTPGEGLCKITCADIRSKNPCYDPVRHLAEDGSWTLKEILQNTNIPNYDRVWVARKFLNDRFLRLFAVDCALRALGRIKYPDQRSLDACAVATRFANGQAISEELAVTRRAAYAAYADAPYAAAAYAAAAYAAYVAAADDAAKVDAYAAAAYAAYAAADDAYAYDARKAEFDNQVNWLINLATEEGL